MRYRGLIFDLDGVLCSTDEYHYQAWKALADRLGIPFDRARNDMLRGVSRMDSLNIVLATGGKNWTPEEKERLAEEKNRLYRERLSHMTPKDLSPEVRETLLTVRKLGLKMAVGSSSKNAGYILERLGMPEFFDVVVDGNQLSKSKPDPEVFLKAAMKMGLSPGECLVTEDAHAGVEAARRGGFDCAAMGAARNDSRATFWLDHFSEIRELLMEV